MASTFSLIDDEAWLRWRPVEAAVAYAMELGVSVEELYDPEAHVRASQRARELERLAGQLTSDARSANASVGQQSRRRPGSRSRRTQRSEP